MSLTPRPASVVVGLLLAAAPVAALEICFLEEDLPRADRATSSGFDYEFMEELAALVDDPLEPVWLPSRQSFSEIESSDLPLDRLLRGDCAAVASVPGEAALGDYGDELVLSEPYYGAAFELVGAPGVAESLDDLHGKTVAVQLQSLAHAVLGWLGIDWRVRSSTAELLELVDRGEADAALVWGPALGPHGRRPLADFEAPRALRWNEHVAMRRDVPIGAWVDETVRRLTESGRMKSLAEKYGIPYHAPFPTTSDPESLRNLRK